MYVEIGGIDFTSYIESHGFKWGRNDVDSKKSGRSISALMNRNRIAIKIKLEITCRDMNTSEIRRILQAIKPEYVNVTYDDPQDGRRTNVQFYSNNVPATCSTVYDDGTEIWDGITFPLIER